MGHTPGPWAVRGDVAYAGFGVNDANGKSVASFPSSMSRDKDEKVANAMAIAAVPALVAALQKIANQSVPIGEIGNAMAAVARDALAKAGL